MTSRQIASRLRAEQAARSKIAWAIRHGFGPRRARDFTQPADELHNGRALENIPGTRAWFIAGSKERG